MIMMHTPKNRPVMKMKHINRTNVARVGGGVPKLNADLVNYNMAQTKQTKGKFKKHVPAPKFSQPAFSVERNKPRPLSNLENESEVSRMHLNRGSDVSNNQKAEAQEDKELTLEDE